MHAAIRAQLVELFGEHGASVPILYGGSVKPDNAAEILGAAHLVDQPAAALAAREQIGFRQQRAFLRHRPGITRQGAVVLHHLPDHVAGQAFGGRQPVLDGFAFDQDRRDGAHRRVGRQRIFARLQLVGEPPGAQAEFEQPDIGHRAAVFQHLGDGMGAGARRYQDDGFALRGTGLVPACLHPGEGAGANHSQHDQEYGEAPHVRFSRRSARRWCRQSRSCSTWRY